MKHFVFILMLLVFLTGSTASGQVDKSDCVSSFDTLTNREIYFVVDKMPEFPGGKDSLNQFIANNLKYPKTGGCFEGAVYVSFIIEPDGELTNKIIKKGIYKPADNEAMIMINKMPNWKPGTCNGKVVPVEIILPVKFKL